MNKNEIKIFTLSDAVIYINHFYSKVYEETSYVIFLNKKRKIISCKVITNLTLMCNSTFCYAAECSASFLVIIRKIKPYSSLDIKEDIKIKNKYVKVGEMLNIKLLGYVITFGESYFSF